jgi:hypothetical protein
MRAPALLLVIGALAAEAGLAAQARRTQPRTAKPAPAPITKTEPAMMMCPSVLGEGVTTQRAFCDVQIGRDPAAGILITIPPHTGPVTLAFDLHNRHTYSEDQVKASRGYHRYTASIGVLALDNTLLSRAVVQNEFRTAADLFDRVSGGVGPGGVKAVAPTGVESIEIEIPPEEDQVSILGEKLAVIDVDGLNNYSVSGRPIAVISNVMIKYRPGPARKPPTRRK